MAIRVPKAATPRPATILAAKGAPMKAEPPAEPQAAEPTVVVPGEPGESEFTVGIEQPVTSSGELPLGGNHVHEGSVRHQHDNTHHGLAHTHDGVESPERGETEVKVGDTRAENQAAAATPSPATSRPERRSTKKRRK